MSNIQTLLDWADERNLSESNFPRDKEKLLKLTTLDLSERFLSELPKEIGQLTELYISEI